MKYPQFLAPATLHEALEEYDREPQARILAGGTDLIPRMRAGRLTAEVLIDLGRLGLDQVRCEHDSLVIGAAVTHGQARGSPLIQKHNPVLAEACRQIGSPPIQNRGTLGGNLVNASPAADSATPLLVLDASLVLASLAGERQVRLAELFIAPGQTSLRHGEILKEIHVPIPKGRQAARFIKIGRRSAMAIAILSVSVCLALDAGGNIASARIAFGSAAPTPMRAEGAEAWVTGKTLEPGWVAEAARLASLEISPISDIRASRDYRTHLGGVLVTRALESILAEFSREVGVAEIELALQVNGTLHHVRTDAARTLLAVLREDLHLTSVKEGCGKGDCGACVVVVDGLAVNACLVLAGQTQGREVLTVEGLEREGKLHPLQAEFMRKWAFQCGYCTPGMLMSAYALLLHNPQPSEAEIREAIAGNLCRCTSYQTIVDAISAAAGQMTAGTSQAGQAQP